MSDLLGDLISRKENLGLGDDAFAALTDALVPLGDLPSVSPLDPSDPVNRRLVEIMGDPESAMLAHRLDQYEAQGVPLEGDKAKELAGAYRKNKWQAIYELGVERGAAEEMMPTLGGLTVWPESMRGGQEKDALDTIISTEEKFLGGIADAFIAAGYGALSLFQDPEALNRILGLDTQLGSKPPQGHLLLGAMREMLRTGVPIGAAYASAEHEEAILDQQANIVDSVARLGGETAGFIVGLFGSPIGKAIGLPGKLAGQAATKAPKWLKMAAEVGGTAVGWGAYQGLAQYYDPETGELNGAGQRIVAAAEAAAWWPAYELVGRLAGAAFQGLKRVEAEEAFIKWAKAKGLETIPGSANYSSVARNTWVMEGMPGLDRMTVKGIVDRAKITALESAGFSALDSEMRSDIFDAIVSGDREAGERAGERFLGTWLGLSAIKAIGVANIPQWKRASAPKFAEMASGKGKEKPGEGGAVVERGPEPGGTGGGGALVVLEHMGWRGNQDGVFRRIGDDQRTFRITDGKVEVSDSLLPVIRDSELPPLEAIREATLRSDLEARRLLAGRGGVEVDTDGGIVIPRSSPDVPSRHIVHRFGSTYEGDFFRQGTWRKTELPALPAPPVSPQQARAFDSLALSFAKSELPPEILATALKTLEVIRDVPRELDPQVNEALQLAESGVLAQVDPVQAVHALATVAAGYQTAQRAVENLSVETAKPAKAEGGEPKVEEAGPRSGKSLGIADDFAKRIGIKIGSALHKLIKGEKSPMGVYNTLRKRAKELGIDRTGEMDEAALVKAIQNAEAASVPQPVKIDRAIRDQVAEIVKEYGDLEAETGKQRSEFRKLAKRVKESELDLTMDEARRLSEWVNDWASADPIDNVKLLEGVKKFGETLDSMTFGDTSVGKARKEFWDSIYRDSELGQINAKLAAAVVGVPIAAMGAVKYPGLAALAGIPFVYPHWAKSQISRVRDLPTPEASEFAKDAEIVADRIKEFGGVISGPLTDFLWKVSGLSYDPRQAVTGTAAGVAVTAGVAGQAIAGPAASVSAALGLAVGASMKPGEARDLARSHRQATRKLEEIVWEKPYSYTPTKGEAVQVEIGTRNATRLLDNWSSRSREDADIIEGLMNDPHVASIFRSAEALDEGLVRLMEGVGAQRTLADGRVVPITYNPNPNNRRMARLPSNTLIQIALNPGHTMFDVVADAFSRFAGVEKAEAMRELRDLGESLVREDSIEVQRKLRYLPDTLRVSGEVVPLFVTEPHAWAMRVADKRVKRAATISQFGQFTLRDDKTGAALDARGQQTLERIAKIRNAGRGEEAEIARLMKLLSGIPLDAGKLWSTEPMVHGGKFRRYTADAIRAGLDFSASAALSMAYLVNIPEPFGNLAVVTDTAHVFHAYRNLIGAARTGQLKTLAEGLRNSGAITEEVPYSAIDGLFDLKGWARLAKEGRFLQEFKRRGQWLSVLTKVANEFNDVLAAVAAQSKAGELARVGGNSSDVARLVALGFTRAEADLMVKPGGMTPHLEKRYIRKVVSMTQGATTTPAEKGVLQNIQIWRLAIKFDTYASATARTFEELRRSVKDLVADGRMTEHEALKFIASAAGKKAATGAASILAAAIVGFGAIGISKVISEMLADPLEWFEDLVWIAIGGGPVDAVRWQLESADEFTDVLKALYPVRLASEIAYFISETGPYRDLTFDDQLAELVRRNLPAWNNTIRYAGNPEFAAAKSAAYTWMKGQGIKTGGSGPAQNTKFSEAMREAALALERGDEDRFRSRFWDGVREGGASKSANSIMARTFYRTIKRNLSDKQINDLRNHLGEEMWGAIMDQYNAAKALADVVR